MYKNISVFHNVSAMISVNLAVFSIEKELSWELPLDEVIDEFAAEDKNTRILFV